ncbi:MAG: peptidylprolyl isomerase [Oscillospiraceae bacterium]
MKFKRLKSLILCAAVAVGALFTGCSSSTVKGGNIDEVTVNSGDLVAVIEIENFGTIKAKLFPEAAPVGVENFQKLCESGYYQGKNIHRVASNFMMQGGSLNGDGTGGEAMVNGGSFDVESADNMRHFYGALCYANAAGNNSTQFYIVNNKQQGAFDSELAGFKSQVDQCKELIKQSKEQGLTDYVAYYTQYRDYFQKFVDKYNAFPENVKELYNKNGGVPQLDGDYTVFGQVYEGFDVIDAIAAVEVEDNGAGAVTKPVEEIIIKNITVSTVE